jgi:ribosomal protein S18 acetylase RimI-like enzyme
MTDGLRIYPAETETDLDLIRELFREYQEWLGVDLCFQGFEEELKSLPGVYAPPWGRLYLVGDEHSGETVGCVAFRPRDDGRCEMKRLYVRDAWKGRGLGRELAELTLKQAKAAGHTHMCLDTLGHLTSAIGLYRSMGFQEIEAYYDNPLDDVRYLEIELN